MRGKRWGNTIVVMNEGCSACCNNRSKIYQNNTWYMHPSWVNKILMEYVCITKVDKNNENYNERNIYESLVSTSICRYLYTFSSLYLSRYTIHLMFSTEGIHLISPVPMISDVYLASTSTRCIHCLVDLMMTCIYSIWWVVHHAPM